jgi:hypothetical protein
MLAVVVLIVIQILAQGYLPVDDSLRHAGKAVSGRSWSQLLLLRPGVVDFSPGWHAILRGIHLVTGANAHTIVLVEVAFLFVAVSIAPLLLMRRPEAWIGAITIGAAFEPQLIQRMVIGRPLVLSMAILVTMCLTWRRLDGDRFPRLPFAGAALLVAAATWIHGSWYLWALPIVATLLAGQRRVAVRLAAATIIGVLTGALLTGHPINFLWQNLALALNIGGGAITVHTYEFQPYPFFPLLALAIPAILIARKTWLGEPARTAASDPVLILALLGLALGFKSARFWLDWGMPALLAWFALEMEALWVAQPQQRRRLLVAGALGVASFLICTANLGGRWTPRLEPAFRTWLEPHRVAAMPDSGGILYTDDRRIFYEMLYRDPSAQWKYTLGYSPELMPAEDLAVYFDRQVTHSIESLEPWARKMGPQDRLLIRDPRGIPLWNWLEWQQIEGGFYSGRVKRQSP